VVRYRFVTTEVPGGYFGSEFDDYFAVSIRSQRGGGRASERNSMNGLGLGAFEFSTGATAFRTVTLPVDPQGDVVQVDIVVANVADGLLDSFVIVDFVAEMRLRIETAQVHDIHSDQPVECESMASTLLARPRFLSAEPHPYFQGNTRLNGTIAVAGPEGDTLQSLELEVRQGRRVVARGSLAAGARDLLLRPFGSAGRVEVASTRLLWEVPSSQFTGYDPAVDLTLRLRAMSAMGEASELSLPGTLRPLLRFETPPAEQQQRARGRQTERRFGARNDTIVRDGGDDWAQPQVRDWLVRLWQVHDMRINDVSNMNGGAFCPHADHRVGCDADLQVGGYTGHVDNQVVVDALIDILQDEAIGPRVALVWADYKRGQGGPIDRALGTVVTAVAGRSGNRTLRGVVYPQKDHKVHLHLRFLCGLP
jgi:hypothetical protein